MRWIVATPLDDGASATLSRELKLAPAISQILASRGICDPDEARSFLEPRLRELSDPFLIPGMSAAVKRLLAAVDRGEKIVLHGDYDVDGITSLALLGRVIEEMGGKVRLFLPQRVDEGYGLTRESLSRCLKEYHPNLLVAVDCGTSAREEINWLTSQGVDTIVIDHHEPGGPPPDCKALVNPKVTGGDNQLCSAGLAFKTSHALLKSRPTQGIDLKAFLDLVALGTVTDLVPLLGENRILTQKGLARLPQTRWDGLRALQSIAAVEGTVKAADVSFRLGPRLNAAGRIGTAEEALRLLLTTDPNEARSLALKLDQQNRQRQSFEQETLREALQQIADIGIQNQFAIIVGSEGWHPGVVGIVASRLSRQFHRPAIVVAFDADGIGRGSGRSIEGFSLLKVLQSCGEYLDRFGGHAMASGLSVRREVFQKFQQTFQQKAKEMLSGKKLEITLSIDAMLPLEQITHEFMDQHEKLAPFGMGNPQPLFMARGLTPTEPPLIMQEKHLRATFAQRSHPIQAVFFNAPLNNLPRPPWDVAFHIERSVWRSEERIQMHIREIRSAT